MKYDKFGRAHTTEEELCDILYSNPSVDLSLFECNGTDYNKAVKTLYVDFPLLKEFTAFDEDTVSMFEFDQAQQNHWYMPDEYKTLDIAQHILDLCTTEPELQRVGEELLLYQERDLFNLLRYLKYFVDTMRLHNVVWGLGRGSSVASYVLYLLGVHKVNSLYYDLPIEEFLK